MHLMCLSSVICSGGKSENWARPVDQRDELTWVTIELTRFGETKVEDGTIESLLRKDLELEADFPIFVPAVTFTKNGKTVTRPLVEGYVFVASGLVEVAYFALERRPYVEKVLDSTPGPTKMRVLHTIPNKHIEDWKVKRQELLASTIQEGEQVRVLDGPYRALEGKVLGVEGDQAFVQVCLRSINLIITAPRVFLEALDED